MFSKFRQTNCLLEKNYRIIELLVRNVLGGRGGGGVSQGGCVRASKGGVRGSVPYIYIFFFKKKKKNRIGMDEMKKKSFGGW